MSAEPIDLDAELIELLDADAQKAARHRAGVEKRRATAARKRELREAARERIAKLSDDHPWWCTRDLHDRWQLDPVTMEHTPAAQATRKHSRVVGSITINATEFEDGRFSRVLTFCSSASVKAGPDALRAYAADLYAAADTLEKINATEWWNVDR